MNRASIRRHAEGAFVGASCLLLAALFAGCVQEASQPKAAAPVAAKSLATSNAVAAVTTAPAVAEPAQGEKVAKAKDAAKAEKAAKAETAAKAEKAAKTGDETVQVGACDGGKPVEVPAGLKGQALADNLMDQWKRNHPEANWVAEEKQRHALKPPADNSEVLEGSQAKGSSYGNFAERDLLAWSRETEKFVAEGSRIFHDGDALGSEVAVSCDMCHPHAANTHPETYPKFQTQLGRVALLRDMIEWCIENPVRGEHLEADGPTMRALEAYILSQRKGVPMNYGKH